MEYSTIKNHIRTNPVERINIRLLPDNAAVLVVHYTNGKPVDISDFADHRILRATLAHGFMLFGIPLTIDDVPAGTIQRYNDELVQGYFPACQCHMRYRDGAVHSSQARKTRAGTRRSSRL